MAKHHDAKRYSFQTQKCTEETCAYCSINVLRMPNEVFNYLQFLPYPLLDPSSQKYKPFDQTYGKETTDTNRSFLTSKPGKPKADVKNHNLLVPLLQVCFLIHSVFHNTFLILGVAYVEGGVRGWAPLTKVKYALSILQIYWKYTSKVYLKHNSSILEAYFKYTSSILQPNQLQKKYTLSLLKVYFLEV